MGVSRIVFGLPGRDGGIAKLPVRIAKVPSWNRIAARNELAHHASAASTTHSYARQRTPLSSSTPRRNGTLRSKIDRIATTGKSYSPLFFKWPGETHAFEVYTRRSGEMEGGTEREMLKGRRVRSSNDLFAILRVHYTNTESRIILPSRLPFLPPFADFGRGSRRERDRERGGGGFHASSSTDMAGKSRRVANVHSFMLPRCCTKIGSWAGSLFPTFLEKEGSFCFCGRKTKWASPIISRGPNRRFPSLGSRRYFLSAAGTPPSFRNLVPLPPPLDKWLSSFRADGRRSAPCRE